MRKLIVLFSTGLTISACASLDSSTLSKGISFGMSTEQVQGVIQRSDVVVEASPGKIVSEGPWDKDQSIRKKTFSFVNGELECIKYEYLRGPAAIPKGVTPVVCK